MIIGVMSDSHNNLSNTLYALNTYRERGIETIIHCGDLTSLEMVSHFSGFRVIYVIGNMDFVTGAIKKRFMRLNSENFVGTVYRGSLDGIPVAVTHGHIDGKVMDLVVQGRFKWLFHGHTHIKRDEMVKGVHIVNPGTLGGLQREARSFCVVDLTTDNVEFLKIPSN